MAGLRVLVELMLSLLVVSTVHGVSSRIVFAQTCACAVDSLRTRNYLTPSLPPPAMSSQLTGSVPASMVECAARASVIAP